MTNVVAVAVTSAIVLVTTVLNPPRSPARFAAEMIAVEMTAAAAAAVTAAVAAVDLAAAVAVAEATAVVAVVSAAAAVAVDLAAVRLVPLQCQPKSLAPAKAS